MDLAIQNRLSLSIKFMLLTVFLIISSNALSQSCSNDTVKPVIDLQSADTVFHPVTTIYISVDVDVTDNCSDSSEISLLRNININIYSLGMYTEVFTATDKSGNVITKIRYVRVVDIEPPVISGDTVQLKTGTVVDLSTYLGLTDNYDAPSNLRTNLEELYNDVDFNSPGYYKAIYQTEDSEGNVSDSFVLNVVIADDLASSYDALLSQIAFYPNPSKDKLFVDIPNHSATLCIYNSYGQQVSESYALASTRVEIKLPETPGLYFMQIEFSEELRAWFKIVKQ